MKQTQTLFQANNLVLLLPNMNMNMNMNPPKSSTEKINTIVKKKSNNLFTNYYELNQNQFDVLKFNIVDVLHLQPNRNARSKPQKMVLSI